MSRRSRAKPTSTFDESPPDKSKYSKAIERAKSKNRDRPGPLEGAPSFDNLPKKTEPQAAELSPKTASGLQAMAEATAQAQAEHDELGDNYLEEEVEEVAVLSEEEKLRKAIEDRLSPLDIGQYFMGGELTQTVTIIPDKFVVRFRSVSDLEEVFVDTQLKDEGELTGREFLRRSNEWALATHIHTLNGEKWPPLFDGNGTIHDKAMDMRLGKVRKIHTPIFNMLLTNLQWFLERISDSLNAEALGNG